jgi:hypothetical protein
MANIKISDLTPAAAVLGTQEFEVNDSLTSKKVTAAQMLSYINANSGAVDLTSAQTITGVKTFSQPIVGSVTGSAATATSAGSVTGTTTAAVPTSALATGTANNTTFLRGDRTWVTPPSGFSGSETITSAVDVSFTAATKQVVIVDFSTSGRKITLPDATTLTAGGVIYNIYNLGKNAFDVVDSSGTPVSAGLIHASSIQLTLLNNSTARGTWSVSAGSKFPLASRITPYITESFQGSVIVLPGGEFVSMRSTSVTNTSTSLTIRAGTFNNTTNAVTWGSPTTVTLGFNFSAESGMQDGGGDRNIIFVGNGKVVITGQFTSGNTNRLVARAFVISGTSITVGSELTVQTGPSAAAVGHYLSGCIIGNDYFYAHNYTYNFSAGTRQNTLNRLFNVDNSGTITAYGSISALRAAYNCAIPLGDNLAGFRVEEGTSVSHWFTVSRSGTTLTLGAAYTGDTTDATSGNFRGHTHQTIKLSNTLYRSRDSIITLSGTNISNVVQEFSPFTDTNRFRPRGFISYSQGAIGMNSDGAADYTNSAYVFSNAGLQLYAPIVGVVNGELSNTIIQKGILWTYPINNTKFAVTSGEQNAPGAFASYAIMEINV